MNKNVPIPSLTKFLNVSLSAAILLNITACNNDSTTATTEQVKSTEQAEKIKPEPTTSVFTFSGVNFIANSSWQAVGDVKLKGDQRDLEYAAGTDVLANFPESSHGGSLTNLVTVNEYHDVHLEMDINFAKSTNSGIYFLGRYRLNISDIYDRKRWWQNDMGGIYPRWDEEREWKAYDGVASPVNASKPVGEWQKLVIDFKAPRFDENGFKSEYAQFVSVTFNGQTLHQNQVAKGPSRYSMFVDEQSSGPLAFVGSNGRIAIKNLSIEERNFNDVAATQPVSEEDKVPLGAKLGKPMLNLVSVGKDVFKDKGCKECHEVDPLAVSVKTGPSLFGVFTPFAQNITVFDNMEQHNTTITADLDYLNNSIRKSTDYLAIRKSNNGEDKTFLPIMPSYSNEAITDEEILALQAYFQSLNSAETKGPDYVWQEEAEAPYVLQEDATAELVGQSPRLVRVNIGDAVSGRAYHVGLPNQLNYSFDPRTFAIEMIWSGRYLSLKNEKKGRADAPSEPGVNAKVWPAKILKNLFQPVLANGEKVDFSFKEPTNVNGALAESFLNHATDFMTEIAKIDGQFIGVDTPKDQLPVFHYRVNENLLSLTFSIEPDNTIHALFDMNNKAPQAFYIGNSELSDISVSAGKIADGYWQVAAGQHQGLSFSAKVKDAPQYVKTEDPDFIANNPLQPMTWSKAENKILTLPEGYKLESASMPHDKFGREILFEPLGIAFNSKKEAFVSTRTAGVWKITNGHWQQFAEGVFGSLGLVVDNDNTIVISEKPGLTRLFDNDKDGWAEKREVVSDKFRFNSNYHEYLHGPIKLADGSYIFTLNLAHSLPGGYGSGGAMSTLAGYRGWALKVDPQGNTIPFANGLRSPAGIAVNQQGDIYYTDNQGDFQGTSKLYRLKEGAYYGHPAGLVDNVGMTVKSAEITFDNNKHLREKPVGLLPHGKAMNSPGHPVWDVTSGKFGPYQGQMFIGDQSKSNVFRVHSETVNGVEQSSLLPFMKGTASGVMRLTFSPADNAMWVGQTGRGWWALGGEKTALQRIVWDGKTVPQSIHSIAVTAKGYRVNFTQAISQSAKASFKQLKISSWYYQENSNYGSEEMGVRDEQVTAVTWLNGGKTVDVTLANFAVDQKDNIENTTRVYQFDLTKTDFANALDPFHAVAWYTLHEIPKS